MNILLVNSPTSWKDHKVVNPNPPTGLLYLTSYVRASNAVDAEVKVFDPAINGLGVKSTINRISNWDFDVIGINMSTSVVEISSEIISRIDGDDVLSVVGGIHPSLDAEDALSRSGADVAVRDEGEITFEEVLAKYQNNEPLEDVFGISYWEGGQIHENTDRSFIPNLDAIPFPAWDAVNLDEYARKRKIAHIVSSRGCPHACIFCSTPTLSGRNWRARSPENVAKEIRRNIRKFDVEEIHFLDDQFAVDEQRVADISDLIEPLDVIWRAITRVGISNGLLEIMEQSGCYKLSFGVESGSEEVIEQINKHITLDQVEETMAKCDEIGINAKCFFMLGFPFETPGHIAKTINFAVKLNREYGTRAAFNIVKPYPGTELIDYTDVAEDFGLLRPGEDLDEEARDLIRKYGDIPKSPQPEFINGRNGVTELVTLAYTAYNEQQYVTTEDVVEASSGKPQVAE